MDKNKGKKKTQLYAPIKKSLMNNYEVISRLHIVKQSKIKHQKYNMLPLRKTRI